MDTLRGDHSTGMGLVEIGKEKDNEPIVFKRAMAGPDFLTLPQTKKFIYDIEKYSVIMAHNRYSTQGAHTNLNAHPFQYDFITLVHNGHVNNAFTLVPADKRHPADVDSAQVCASMAINGVKETLEQITGAFALVWHDSRDGTLNFARNAQRPLKFCYVKGENTMWWMSEKKMLSAILDRRNVTIDTHMYNVPEKVWMKFNVNNLREYTTVPFVPRLQGMTRSATTTSATGHSSTTQTSSTPVAGIGVQVGAGTNVPKGTFFRGARVAKAQLTLIKNILDKDCGKVDEGELKKREFEIKKNSCRPTKPTKIRGAADRLRNKGFTFDQELVVQVRKWDKYSNQKKLGAISGVIFNTEVPVHLASQAYADYVRYNDYSVLLCKAVNVKPDPNSTSQVLVAEPHPMAPEFNVAWKDRYRGTLQSILEAKEGGNRPLLRLTARQESLPNGDSAGDLDFCGPNGRSISAARFKELTKDGCSVCCGDICHTVEESHRILWMMEAPICPNCYTDPKVINQYGIPARSLLLN